MIEYEYSQTYTMLISAFYHGMKSLRSLGTLASHFHKLRNFVSFCWNFSYSRWCSDRHQLWIWHSK